jgi:hypothetical protein
MKLKGNYIEWSLKHLQKYSHSDFYPKLFEFAAITHNWLEVKKYLLSLDLDAYQPKSPMINLAPKTNGNFRVVHQLDPVDSLIYTSLIREACKIIENYRVPQAEKTVFSYRIKPDLEGSFFSHDTGWDDYIARTNELVEKYPKGYVIVADITDFYNQIYTHRIGNLIAEAGNGSYDEQAKTIENFLLALNLKTSKGIPVGPAPSIILSELIMGSIDKKIITYTNDFVRYADDMRMFFDNFRDAMYALHDLTQYLYSYHRLVFSGEKTKILTTQDFKEHYMTDEKKQENTAVRVRADEIANEKVQELMNNLPPYSDDFNYDEAYEETLLKIFNEQQLDLLSSTYRDLFVSAYETSPRDYALLRHILRQSAKYRVRSIVPLVLDHFYGLRPIIRETVIYLKAVINERTVVDNKSKFEKLLSSLYVKLPFINIWISYLLQDECFNHIGLSLKYDNILSERARALIALRQKDTTWLRGFRDNMNVLGPWDKRAVLYSTSILPSGEMKPWVRAVASNGDIIDKSISAYLLSKK